MKKLWLTFDSLMTQYPSGHPSEGEFFDLWGQCQGWITRVNRVRANLEQLGLTFEVTTARPDGRLPVNIDLYLPSLPCGELITEVTDESRLRWHSRVACDDEAVVS